MQTLSANHSPLATLGVFIAGAAGWKKPQDYYDMVNPWEKILKRMKAIEIVEPDVAALAIELRPTLPAWVRGALDWDLLRLAAPEKKANALPNNDSTNSP